MSWRNRVVSSKSGSKFTDRHKTSREAGQINMRYNRQTRTRRAVVMAVVQALLKNNRATDAFSAIAPKHSTRSMETGVFLARARVGGCRPTGEATRRVKREASSANSNSNESYGGAEGIAQRLAEGGDGGAAAGVFYNRVGAINRDLSILMANVLAEERLREGSKRKQRKARRLLSASSSPVGHPADETGVEGEGDTRADDVVGLREKSAEESRSKGVEEDEDEGMAVLDAFAASGVRALRYLTEVPGIRRVVANDYDTAAIETIRQAAEIYGAGEELEIHHGDALDAMYAARAGGLGTYDIIDIDPYGCAAGFLDAGVQAVKDGGLLCITSTDMPNLSGAQPGVAFARYGSVPTRSGYHHEMSLRILLHATSAAAGRHRRSIHPVLSVAIDHYVRVFVRVSRSPRAALAAARDSTSYVLQSETCPSFFLLPVLPPPQPSRKDRASAPRAPPSELPGPPPPPRGIAHTATPSAGEESRGDGNGGGGGGAEVTDGTTGGTRESSSPRTLGGVCPETGGALKMGGPIWSGPLHDEAWVERATYFLAAAAAAEEKEEGATLEAPDENKLGESDTLEDGGLASEDHGAGLLARAAARRPRLAAAGRAESLLKAVSRELSDVPLFYNLRDMFSTLGFSIHPPREQVMVALEAAGYRTSSMHREPLALKTDAPDAAVWDVLRCWARDNPQSPPVRPAGRAILDRGPQLIAHVDFATAQQAGAERREKDAAGSKGRFSHVHNPERRWGPLSKWSVMAGAVPEVEQEGGRGVDSTAILPE